MSSATIFRHSYDPCVLIHSSTLMRQTSVFASHSLMSIHDPSNFKVSASHPDSFTCPSRQHLENANLASGANLGPGTHLSCEVSVMFALNPWKQEIVHCILCKAVAIEVSFLGLFPRISRMSRIPDSQAVFISSSFSQQKLKEDSQTDFSRSVIDFKPVVGRIQLTLGSFERLDSNLPIPQQVANIDEGDDESSTSLLCPKTMGVKTRRTRKTLCDILFSSFQEDCKSMRD